MSRPSLPSRLDESRARAMADAFYDACGVPCQLCDGDGQVLSGQKDGSRFCTDCRAACALAGRELTCEKVHLYGALQAERFGWQYIYFCPCGLTWFASPILIGGRLNGALVGGPVLIMDEEDFFAHGLFQREAAGAAIVAALQADLALVSRMAPSRVSSLSKLLYAAALSLGDGAELLHEERQEEMSDIKHRDMVYKAIAYIREHYRDRVTLEETAEFVRYSPSYFSRVFKADMGESFNSYLNRQRIERSKALLLQDGATVLSVSQAVGFDDPSYFSRVFRRVTGASPGKFRETGGRAAAT